MKFKIMNLFETPLQSEVHPLLSPQVWGSQVHHRVLRAHHQRPEGERRRLLVLAAVPTEGTTRTRNQT